MYNNILTKHHKDVVKDLEEDKDSLTYEDIRGLYDYEFQNDKRTQVLTYLSDLLAEKKDTEEQTRLSTNKRRNTKMAEDNKGSYIVLTPESIHKAIRLVKFGGVTITRKAPTKATPAMVDYMKNAYPGSDFEIMSDLEVKKRDEKIAKAKETK